MTRKTTEHWQKNLPEEWTVKQTDDHGNEIEIPLRDHPALQKYATKDEAVKALVHAQRMLGKNPDGYVRLPSDEDAPEEVAAFYAALGRPEDSNGYQLPHVELPDGFEIREDLVSELREKAHELGLTPAQVGGLYQWFLSRVLDAHHLLEADAASLRDTELESLRSVHRGDTPSMLDKAMRAAQAIGGDELLAALDTTRAGDHATVINAFAKIAPLVLESGMRSGAAGWGEDMTIEQLREMMRDPRYHDPSRRDAAFVKKVDQGFELLYPGEYVSGNRI
ncbi:hypothetical protein [Pseudodesulfovibrio sediminis]|uniref:Uncharacterized protein n=1 Tax=Pseudodesulfovibrio sediminis TaxID=2810563 RepID=A0ABN6EVD8_9BACT|nr:hypothetical protein [Pseudodesulfovibrio sediminis]BCS89091.1 hypothetical protein PSDVSF_23330 [Pseudodesulfovibrio sediminis]